MAMGSHAGLVPCFCGTCGTRTGFKNPRSAAAVKCRSCSADEAWHPGAVAARLKLTYGGEPLAPLVDTKEEVEGKI